MIRLFLLLSLLLFPGVVAAQDASLICVVGDSTAAGLPWTNDRVGWPQRLQMAKQFQRFALVNNAVGGLRCDEIEGQTFTTFIVGTSSRGCTRILIQCTLNDLLQNRTASQIWGSALSPGPMLRMINSSTGAGVKVTVFTSTPLGGSYNYPPEVRTEHMDLNSRIRAKLGVAHPDMVTVVDVYRALGQTGPILTALSTDPGPGVTMPSVYNYNDGIHFTSGNGTVVDSTTGDGRFAEAIMSTPGAL